METIFLKTFSKDLSQIKDHSIKPLIKSTIEQVEQAQTPQNIDDLKKLSGFKNAYRIKVKEYRIGVFIENDKVIFARVVHRKDIYRLFP
ncbi:MAG TPA: type II toxin-antitoxin system RelE/ParE family toxin [Chitinophagales bacterium]|nr:type II toxin-antitoxin system RelE/ParE family toxin [Chitinophagales bacterium]